MLGLFYEQNSWTYTYWCSVSQKQKNTMLGLFKKKSKKEKLQQKYNKLLDESYKLSHTDRKASDLKRAEAEAVYAEIEKTS